MKKLIYLFLMLFAISTYGQADFPEGIQISGGQPTVSSVNFLTTTDNTLSGLQGKIAPVNLPIPYSPTNYSISNQSIGQHLTGIDTRLGQISSTTAGITQRVYFTADNTTVTAGTFFTSSTTGKGSTATGSPPALVLADNTKGYFTKDVISVAFPAATIGYAGSYTGQLTVSATPTPVATQQRFTVEIYRTDNGGTPIASGVSGAPTGDLGVTVVAILDSGILNLTAGSITNIPVTGILTQNITLNTGERLRYHVSAAKIGAGGGNVTFGVYYGSSYNSYYDVPVAITTDAVLNKSAILPAITSTDALNLLSKQNTYVTPEQYGAIGDGVTDDSAPMQNAISSGKMVLLGAKTYLLNSTITVANPVKIFGAGNLSVLKTTQNLPVLNITSNLVTLKDFKILGNGRGTSTNYATTRPLQNGIKIDGAYYNNTVENIIFDSLGNAGIYGANNQNGVSTDVTSSINVNSCFFFNSLFGINFDTLFEYNLVYNSVFKNNETGIVIKGGNNPMIGGHVLNNRTGVSVISGSNDSHSTLSSVTINHNIEHGISVGAIVNGFTFSNCVVFFNDISLISSNGVLIDGGLFKNNASLVFTNTESTTFQNVKFMSTSIPTTFSGNTNLRFFNNSYPLGTSVPSSMKESIENITNTNIFDINGTTSAGNLIRMRFNGSNRFLFGSDSGITAGNDADLNAYVYGNNNLFLSTNNVKRLTISGSGLATFQNNIVIPDGTALTHAVNKGQLDLKADLASPNLTGTPTAPTATAGTNTTQIATTAFVQNASSSGTYTPTIAGIANFTSSTLVSATYTVVGQSVTVLIDMTVKPTSASTLTEFSVTLPITVTAFGGTQASIGTGTFANTDYLSMRVSKTNSTTAKASFKTATDTNSGSVSLIFTYQK